jgi:hypothetical protein
MGNKVEQQHVSSRELTIEEMHQVGGGVRSFNPQPDPPGVMHNPPDDLKSTKLPPDPY